MYAAIRRYRMIGGNMDILRHEVERKFVPQVREVAGFQAYYLVEVGNDEIATISVFDDRAGADESVRRAAAWVQGNATMREALSGPPEVIAGDVRLFEYAGHEDAATQQAA